MKSIVLKTVDTIIDMNKLQCIKFLVLLIFRSISKITVAINNAILDNEAPTIFIILKILNNSMKTFSRRQDSLNRRMVEFLPIKFWIKNFFFQSNFCLNTLLENIWKVNFFPINLLSGDVGYTIYRLPACPTLEVQLGFGGISSV